MDSYDFIIVGCGIAGASAGYELAAHGRVLVLERESQPGYHTTGRSAALFVQTHGPAVIRALARGAKNFFLDPPAGFTEHPLLTPRGMLLIGRADQSALLDHNFAQSSRHIASIRRLDRKAACALVPLLKEDYLVGAVLDPEARRRLRSAGVVVWLDAPPHTLAERVGSGWRRPLLDEDPAGTLSRLDAVRRPVYGELANVVLRVGGRRPQALAEDVIRASRTLLECGCSAGTGPAVGASSW